jgi:hypothetical protein
MELPRHLALYLVGQYESALDKDGGHLPANLIVRQATMQILSARVSATTAIRISSACASSTSSLVKQPRELLGAYVVSIEVG